jgi:sulfur carrier protein
LPIAGRVIILPFTMVTITVNGDRQEFQEAPTIAELLARLDAPRSAVAVEVNRVIVPRRAHVERRLEEGDEVEVVTFVGGG